MTALLADPVYKLHVTGEGHPERPARYDATMGGLEHAGLAGQTRTRSGASRSHGRGRAGSHRRPTFARSKPISLTAYRS